MAFVDLIEIYKIAILAAFKSHSLAQIVMSNVQKASVQ